MEDKTKNPLANDRLRQLLATMAHELGNPVSVIQKAAALLRETQLSEEQEDLLMQLRGSADMLAGILRDLSVWSSENEQAVSVHPQNFQLREAFRLVEVSIAEQVRAKELELEFEVDEALPVEVYGDVTKLLQILFNLTGNAVKFTNAGSVRVHISRFAELNSTLWMRILVADTGPGIPAIKQAAAFEPFGREGKQAGMGMGLYVVQKLVNALGGYLSLESRVGVGSTFELRIPFQEAKTSSSAESSSLDDRIWSVLIVEDHAINRLAVRQILKNEWPRMDIAEAENGKEALSLLENQRFDLVLLDLHMPVLDGYETLQILENRMEILRKNMAVLAMSAQLREGVQSGFDGHISKPFDREVVILEVRGQLKKLGGNG